MFFTATPAQTVANCNVVAERGRPTWKIVVGGIREWSVDVDVDVDTPPSNCSEVETASNPSTNARTKS